MVIDSTKFQDYWSPTNVSRFNNIGTTVCLIEPLSHLSLSAVSWLIHFVLKTPLKSSAIFLTAPWELESFVFTLSQKLLSFTIFSFVCFTTRPSASFTILPRDHFILRHWAGERRVGVADAVKHYGTWRVQLSRPAELDGQSVSSPCASYGCAVKLHYSQRHWWQGEDFTCVASVHQTELQFRGPLTDSADLP